MVSDGSTGAADVVKDAPLRDGPFFCIRESLDSRRTDLEKSSDCFGAEDSDSSGTSEATEAGLPVVRFFHFFLLVCGTDFQQHLQKHPEDTLVPDEPQGPSQTGRTHTVV